MTLPASGQLSLNAIHIELGGTSGTSVSLAQASLGTISAINTANDTANRPDSTAPHAMSEFYSYNHTLTYAGPELSTVLAEEAVGIGCGINLEIDVSWTTTVTDDTNYKLQVWEYGGGGALLQDNLTTAASTWTHVTGATGDPLGTGTFHEYRYTIRVVRLSDSQVMSLMDTNTINIESGAAC